MTLGFARCRPDTVVLESARTVYPDEGAPQDLLVFRVPQRLQGERAR